MTEKLMTYALGRGLATRDMPVVRRIVRDAARKRLPVYLADSRHRRQHAVSDADQAPPRENDAVSRERADEVGHQRSSNRFFGEGLAVMFITKISFSRRTVLRGMGSDRRSALLDSMVPALTGARRDPRQAAAPFRGSLHSAGRTARLLDTGHDRGENFEFSPILKPLEPYRDSLTGRLGTSAVRGRPRRDVGGVAERQHTQTHRSAEDVHAGTTIDQMVAKRDRSGHGISVTRTGDRRLHRLYRRLRPRLLAAPT